MVEQKRHETRIRIRYKDTDRMGVVYYGNYFTFFEVARAEFLRDHGYPYADVEADGYTLLVIEASANYHASARYDVTITVKTLFNALRNVRVRFDYEIFDEKGKRLVTGHTIHACMNAQQKPTKIPERLRRIATAPRGS